MSSGFFVDYQNLLWPGRLSNPQSDATEQEVVLYPLEYLIKRTYSLNDMKPAIPPMIRKAVSQAKNMCAMPMTDDQKMEFSVDYVRALIQLAPAYEPLTRRTTATCA